MPLETRAAQHKLQTPVGVLRDFGFEHVHVSDVPADELALQALQRLLTEYAVDAESPLERVDGGLWQEDHPAARPARLAAPGRGRPRDLPTRIGGLDERTILVHHYPAF